MSSITRREYLAEVRRLYREAQKQGGKHGNRKRKTELVSNVMEITGMNRKSVIRWLSKGYAYKQRIRRKRPETRGRRTRVYCRLPRCSPRLLASG